MVGLSQLEQVFTRFLSQTQIDAVSVEPKFDYTMFLLLVFDVRRENDTEQWGLALRRLQVEYIVLVRMVLEQINQVGEHLIMAVVGCVMQHRPVEARLTNFFRQTVGALRSTAILAFGKQVLELIQLAFRADVVEDHFFL